MLRERAVLFPAEHQEMVHEPRQAVGLRQRHPGLADLAQLEIQVREDARVGRIGQGSERRRKRGHVESGGRQARQAQMRTTVKAGFAPHPQQKAVAGGRNFIWDAFSPPFPLEKGVVAHAAMPGIQRG